MTTARPSTLSNRSVKSPASTPASQTLARAGHLSTQFIAVIEGSVNVATTPAGHTIIAGPGTQPAAAELVDGHPHAATVSTDSESTLLVRPLRPDSPIQPAPLTPSQPDECTHDHRAVRAKPVDRHQRRER